MQSNNYPRFFPQIVTQLSHSVNKSLFRGLIKSSGHCKEQTGTGTLVCKKWGIVRYCTDIISFNFITEFNRYTMVFLGRVDEDEKRNDLLFRIL